MKQIKFQDLFRKQTLEALNKSKTEKDVKENMSKAVDKIVNTVEHKKHKKTVH